MASHFKWYPAESEVVVPFNARYSFPSQANKAMKMTPRIPPKNNGTFNPGNVIRLEFPAQGYVNPSKTTLEFDVTLIYTPSDGEFSYVRFQNNIQSIFNRVRLLYGATPIEDIPYYNVIVRQLTEWTATNQHEHMDQFNIAEGIGGTSYGISGQFASASSSGVGARTGVHQNVRQKYIQGIDMLMETSITAGTSTTNTISTRDTGLASGSGIVPNNAGSNATQISPITGNGTGVIHQSITGTNPVRRYQVQLALGIFNQEKLIPTKFMASQLAIEITLENPAACMYYVPSSTLTTQPTSVPATTALGTPSSIPPTYQVTNVNLIPEILEFDASYDESFLKGLQTGGVPLKFSTWNNYRFSSSGVSSVNLQIQERSRSVKAIFCMQRRDPPDYPYDSGACFATSCSTAANGATTLQEYQYRIGGRYFPAQPVQCATQVGGAVPNGGCEAFVELEKALNTLGDYRLASNANVMKWAIGPGTTAVDPTVTTSHNILPEFDYDYSLVQWKFSGAPVLQKMAVMPLASQTSTTMSASQRSGDAGSACFAMAIDLETSNGLEISGLNAEEQSDISLIARWQGIQAPGFVFDVFTFIDSMIVLRENNVKLLLIVGYRVDSIISKLYDCFNKWVITVLIKLWNMLNYV